MSLLSEGRGCVWTKEDEAWLDARLREVNGRRTARTLSATQVKAAAESLRRDRLPYVVVHGGDVEDGRQHTSLCLCVATDTGVVVGLGTARTGLVSPDRAFGDLRGWDAWTPMANAVRCEQWANRRAADRRRIAFEHEAPSATSLLDAIRKAPDDDRPRQVYADWLMEQGDPRGEFIAVQCELTRPDLDDGRRLELEARQVSLLSSHGATWLGPLAADAVTASFARGFLDAVTVLDVDSLDAAQATLANEPVRALVFASRRRVDVARVLSWPWLATVRSLDFRSTRGALVPLGREGLTSLASTRKLRGLTSLGFTGQVLGDDGAAQLAGSDAFPALTEFSLTSDTLTSTGVEALTKARWFAGLARLSLSDNELGPDGAELLARVRFKRLTRLSLSSNRIGNDGAILLARTSHLATLESLWLASNRINQTGAEALLSAKTLKRARLVLDGNPIGARFKELVASRV
ncbi:MAG: TIGR02996 domain-containing protein [Myxococcales bacterium]|nr:TIGR02996 domain-containing protein [Myxococcales bacterium]